MTNFLTRLVDRAVVPQPDKEVPLVRPLSAIYESGGFGAELVTQEVETRANREMGRPQNRRVAPTRPRPSHDATEPLQPPHARAGQERQSRSEISPSGTPERETTSQHAARAATAIPSDLRIEGKSPQVQTRIVERPSDKTPRAPASQPITLQSVINHIFRDEGGSSETRKPQPMQTPSAPVDQGRDTLAEMLPSLVSIGRIDVSVAPPLPNPSREAGPPRSQGFASYSRIRRGQER